MRSWEDIKQEELKKKGMPSTSSAISKEDTWKPKTSTQKSDNKVESNPTQRSASKSRGNSVMARNSNTDDSRFENAVKGTLKSWAGSSIMGLTNEKFGVSEGLANRDAFLKDTLADIYDKAGMPDAANVKRVEATKIRDGIKETYNMARDMAREGNTQMSKATDGMSTVPAFATNLGMQMGQMGLDMATGNVLASMFNRSRGSYYDEAIQNGYADNNAALYANLMGAAEVGTEKLFGGLKVMDKFTGKPIVSAIENVKNPMLRTGLGMLGEGTEEAIIDLVNPTVKSAVLEGNRGMDMFVKPDMAEMGYDFLMGAAMGGVGEGIYTGASKVAKPFVEKAQTQKAKDTPSAQNIYNLLSTQGVEDEQAQNSAKALAMALNRYSDEEGNTVSNNQIKRHILAVPEARAIYENYTGQTLSENEAEGRRQVKDYLKTANVIGQEGAEKPLKTQNRASVLGENGQVTQRFVENIKNANPSEAELVQKAHDIFYQAGRSGISYEKMREKTTVYDTVIPRELQMKIHEAGVNDSAYMNVETTKGSGTFANNGKPTKYDSKLTSLAKRTGINIVVAKDLGMSNGFYDGKTGTVYVSETAEYRNIEKDAMLTAAIHEVTHGLKEKSPEEYNNLKNIIKEEMGEEWAKEKSNITEVYKKSGVELSEEGAEDEVIANFCMREMTEEDFSRIINKDRGLAHKLISAIKEWFENIKAKLTGSERAEMSAAIKQWEKMLEESQGEHETVKIDDHVRYSLRGVKIPTYNELISKLDIKVVDISKPKTIGDFRERRKAIRLNAKESVMNTPYRNKDTSALIFVTSSSYTHSFNNKGIEQLNATENIAPLIEEAILTHKENATHGNKETDMVYTFFGAAYDGEKIRPVKLKVKEINIKGQELPTNVKKYFEEHATEYAELYDSVVLEVLEIEKNPQGYDEPTSNDVRNTPSGFDTITVADLLELVNEKYQKYIPKPLVSKDSEGNSLTEAQAEYFKDSKIRDEEGNLKVMYHGTPEDFTVFKPTEFGGIHGSGEGFGIYLTDSSEIAGGYGKNKKTVYVNITKPASAEKQTITTSQLSNFIKTTCENDAKQNVEDGEYDNVNDAIKDTWVSNYEYTYDKPMSNVYRTVAKNIIESNRNDKDIIQEVMSGIGISDFKSAYKFYDMLKKELGFDGFSVMWEGNEVVLAFNSNQIKNIDNANPTSNEDIRYSFNETFGNGYHGYSMSNNAVSAYEQGEKPLSKWTKADIISAAREIDPKKAELLSKVNLSTLKDTVLRKTSWHHTSEYYNRTDFYSIDEDAIERLTEDDIRNLSNRKEEKPSSNTFKGDIEYLEWGGIRKHPKATRKTLTDVNIEERGSFYIVKDDSGNEILRKKIGSNGTYVKNKTLEEQRNALIRDNSSAEAYVLYTEMKKNGYSSSMSGNLYERGRKPSSYDVANGLENFFKKGEQRLSPNRNGGYDIETWNGKEWSNDNVSYSLKDIPEDSRKILESANDKVKFLKAVFVNSNRMDSIIEDSVASNKDYARSYIAWVNPYDFLKATSSVFARDRIVSESTPLDKERLSSESQNIYLNVNLKTGEILGHEGRHRMVALSNENVKYVAVELRVSEGDKYNAKPIETISFKGQEFGDSYIYNGEDIIIHNLIPVSARYQDAVREIFSDSGEQYDKSSYFRDSFAYSLKDSEGNTLTTEQVEFFKESKARDEQGNLLRLYHGTGNAGFNEFEGTTFMTSSRKVAKSYSSTMDIYKPYSDYTIEDIRNILKGQSNFYQKYRVSEEDGVLKVDSYRRNLANDEYTLDETEIETSSLEELAKEVNDYFGLGNESANYAVYANITNPLVIDANEKDNMSIDFEGEQRTTDEIVEIAKERGHDGVIFKNLYDIAVFASTADMELSTVAVAFDSSQIKLTSNTNPTENPDIRYSLKGTDDSAKEIRRLQKANELLKAQLKLSDRTMPNAKDVRTIAKRLIKENSAMLSTEEVEGWLTELYKKMAEPNVNSQELYDMAESIGTSIADAAFELYSDPELNEIRQYVRTSRVSPNNDKDSNIWNEKLRNQYFGRIIISKDGLPIDAWYQELCDMYPSYFDSSLTDTDSILDAVTTIPYENETYIPMYEGYEKEQGGLIAWDIMDSFFDVRSTPKTYADKAEARVQKAINQGRKNVGKEKEKTKLAKEKTKEVRKEMKQKSDAKLKEFREAKKEEISKIRQDNQKRMRQLRVDRDAKLSEQKRFYVRKNRERTQKISRAKRIRQIKAITNDLIRRLNKPSDNKHIPEPLIKPVADFLSVLDLSTDRQSKATVDKLNALRRAMSRLAGSTEDTSLLGAIDGDFIAMIDDLAETIDGRPIGSLNAEEVEKLYQVIKGIKHIVSDYNTLFNLRNQMLIEDVVRNIESEIGGRKDKETKNFVSSLMDDAYNMRYVNPQDFFMGLGDTMYQLYEGLREGMDKKIRNLALVTDRMNEKVKGMELDEWTGDKAKTTTFKVQGGEIELTPAQVMSLYLLSQREQALEHIYIGGIKRTPITIADKFGKAVKKEFKPVKVTPEDVAKIINTLTTEQKTVAEEIHDILNTYTSDWINETSLTLYGYRKATEKDYFPIKTDDNYNNKNYGAVYEASLKNHGSTKQTVEHAKNPIILEDVFDAFASSIDFATSYNAYVVPMTNIQKVLNYRNEDGSLREMLERKFGRQANEYIAKLMVDLNGGMVTKNGSPIINTLLRNYKAAAMGLNLSVVLQQPTAYLRAFAMVDAKYLAEGLKHRGNYEKVKKYSPIAQWKDWGYFTNDVGRQLKNVIIGKETLTDKTFAAIQEADNIAWGKLWNAIEYEIEDTTDLKRGTEEFYQAVGKRFSEVVDRTQVVDSTLHRSHAMRDADTMVKVLTSFMSEPLKSYNMLRTSLLNYGKAKTTENKTTLARSVTAFLVSTTAATMMQSLIYSLRHYDPDDDDNFIEQYFEQLKSSLVGNIVGLTPMLNQMVSMLEGFEPTNMALEGVYSIIKTLQKMEKQGKAIAHGENVPYTFPSLVNELFGNVGKIFGLPIATVTRDLRAMYRMAADTTSSYYMRYIGEKTFSSVKQNKGDFIDILYKAYKSEDYDSYMKIYNDMLMEGIPESDIKSGIKNRIRKDMISDIQSGIAEWDALSDAEKTPQARREIEAKLNEAYEELRKLGYSKKQIENYAKVKAEKTTIQKFYKQYEKTQKNPTEANKERLTAMATSLLDNGWSEEDIVAYIESKK